MTLFLVTTLALGALIGIKVSAAAVLSGKIALALSLLPAAGFGLAAVFC